MFYIKRILSNDKLTKGISIIGIVISILSFVYVYITPKHILGMDLGIFIIIAAYILLWSSFILLAKSKNISEKFKPYFCMDKKIDKDYSLVYAHLLKAQQDIGYPFCNFRSLDYTDKSIVSIPDKRDTEEMIDDFLELLEQYPYLFIYYDKILDMLDLYFEMASQYNEIKDLWSNSDINELYVKMHDIEHNLKKELKLIKEKVVSSEADSNYILESYQKKLNKINDETKRLP